MKLLNHIYWWVALLFMGLILWMVGSVRDDNREYHYDLKMQIRSVQVSALEQEHERKFLNAYRRLAAIEREIRLQSIGLCEEDLVLDVRQYVVDLNYELEASGIPLGTDLLGPRFSDTVGPLVFKCEEATSGLYDAASAEYVSRLNFFTYFDLRKIESETRNEYVDDKLRSADFVVQTDYISELIDEWRREMEADDGIASLKDAKDDSAVDHEPGTSARDYIDGPLPVTPAD